MTLAVRRDGSYFRSTFAVGDEPRGVERVLTNLDFYEILPPLPSLRDKISETITEASEHVESVTWPSVSYIHNLRDHVKARFRMLRHLPADYDGQGANAPNVKSIDTAINFIDRIRSSPNFTATLDDDGSAVIEFEDRGTAFFADITFRGSDTVEMYKRTGRNPSEFFDGPLSSTEARNFLETYINLVL